MALVSIEKIDLKPNPAPLATPLIFEIVFECFVDLEDDLEWKVTFVGSAESSQYDQVLVSVLVGPNSRGKNRFLLETDPPDPHKIPAQDVLGVTALLLTCSFRDREFIRVGYYINVEYDLPELKDNPPPKLNYEHLQRNILLDKPRVTKFPIDWNSPASAPQPPVCFETETIQEEKMEEETPQTPVDAYSNWNSLDVKFFRAIFSFLDLFDLVRCRRVCKLWKSVVDVGSILTSINFEEIEWNDDTDKELLQFALSQTSPTAQSLEFVNSPFLTDMFVESWVKKTGQNLSSLIIENCGQVTLNCLQPILEHCSNLKELIIPQLLNQQTNTTSIVEAICSRLHSLTFLHLQGVSDEDLALLSKYLSKSLISLAVPRSPRITDQGVTGFLKTCESLQVLDISFCFSVTPATVKEIHASERLVEFYASHLPCDYDVNLIPESEKKTIVQFKLKSQISYTSDELFATLKFLDKNFQFANNKIIFQGPQQAALDALSICGFESSRIGPNFDEEEEEDEVSDEEFICEICHNSSTDQKNVTCSRCSRGFHISCLKSAQQPSSNSTTPWLCSECQVGASKKRKFEE